MKKVIFTLIGVVFFSTLNAHAIVMSPGQERPLYIAGMDKLSAVGEFKNAQDITIMTTQQDQSDSLTGLVPSYLNKSTKQYRSVELVITSKQSIGCGSVEYIANLAQPLVLENERVENPYLQHRLTVVLKDHTRRKCMDLPANLWEASVNEGYGFCGTMDSRMELSGHPHVIYTIQDAN